MKIDLTPADKALDSLSGAIGIMSDEQFMERLSDVQKNTIRATAVP